MDIGNGSGNMRNKMKEEEVFRAKNGKYDRSTKCWMCSKAIEVNNFGVCEECWKKRPGKKNMLDLKEKEKK